MNDIQMGENDVKQLVEQIKEQRIQEHLALTVAQSAAIPSGRTLQQEEMELLVADLLKLPEPNYTPDGKIIISMISMEQITKLF